MRAKRLYLAGAAALLTVLAWTGLTLGAGPLRIFLGESTTVSLPYQFSKLAVGDPTVADYLVQKNEAGGSEVLLAGKRAGATNLIVWDVDGKQRDVISLTVLVRDLNAYAREIQAAVGRAPGCVSGWPATSSSSRARWTRPSSASSWTRCWATRPRSSSW
ncbi:MAG: pilus assembly protein N-terminal domain-containing protein [Thermodesulfobacteriota bacterium]